MEKVKIVINGQENVVDVIRYFRLNGIKYLIYTLNETDTQGYVKLYIVRVDEGESTASNVTDEGDWTSIKDTIKTVIKSAKEGNLSVDDLDYTHLSDLVVTDNRVFKLSAPLVEVLGSNKKQYEKTELQTESIVETPNSTVEMEIPTFEMSPEPVGSTIADTMTETPNDISVSNVQTESVVDTSVDYKILYEEIKTSNEILANRVSELEKKLENIKNILN